MILNGHLPWRGAIKLDGKGGVSLGGFGCCAALRVLGWDLVDAVLCHLAVFTWDLKVAGLGACSAHTILLSLLCPLNLLGVCEAQKKEH